MLCRPHGLARGPNGLVRPARADRASTLTLTRVLTGTLALALTLTTHPHPHPNQVYVADTGHHRVAAFSPDGALSFAFGKAGAEPGAFDEPRGLAVAGERVWVADMCNHRLQAFDLAGRHPAVSLRDLDGRLLRTIGRHGRGPSQFTHPVGVGVSGQRLFVSEYSGCRLQ
eukprot:scaffold116951_cov66-Phaeocystis_antarctica.AAC.6